MAFNNNNNNGPRTLSYKAMDASKIHMVHNTMKSKKADVEDTLSLAFDYTDKPDYNKKAEDCKFEMYGCPMRAPYGIRVGKTKGAAPPLPKKDTADYISVLNQCSVFQIYDTTNAEVNGFLNSQEEIRKRVIAELDRNKDYMKHGKPKKFLQVTKGLSLVFRELVELPDGEMQWSDKGCSWLRFFRAATKDGGSFGTRVSMKNPDTNKTDALDPEDWYPLLTTNGFEYIPVIKYQRVSRVGDSFWFKAQLKSIIVTKVFKIERHSEEDDIASDPAYAGAMNDESAATTYRELQANRKRRLEESEALEEAAKKARTDEKVVAQAASAAVAAIVGPSAAPPAAATPVEVPTAPASRTLADLSMLLDDDA